MPSKSNALLSLVKAAAVAVVAVAVVVAAVVSAAVGFATVVNVVIQCAGNERGTSARQIYQSDRARVARSPNKDEYTKQPDQKK